MAATARATIEPAEARKDLEVVVPVGTIIKNFETGEVMADLSESGQTFIAAHGGIGGKGNAHFTSSTHQTPRLPRTAWKVKNSRLNWN